MQSHADGHDPADEAQPDHEPVMHKHGDDTSTGWVAVAPPAGRAAPGSSQTNTFLCG